MPEQSLSSPKSLASLSTDTQEIAVPADNGSTGTKDKDKIPPEKKIKWSPENEKILVEWCDIAQCYKWLNTRAHAKYSVMHAWFTIPAITLSTISGTASFAQTSIPPAYQLYAPMVIGTINICIGILTTVQQYLKISELNESHRVLAIAWDKYARNISIELAKLPEERMDAGHFLKMNRQEFDRLMETSPNIPADITAEFMRTFTKDEWTYSEMCSRLFCNSGCCKINDISSNSSNHTVDLSMNNYDNNRRNSLNLVELGRLSAGSDIEMGISKSNLITTTADKNRQRKEQFEKLKKPDICNIIVSAEENRHPWYKEVERNRLIKMAKDATGPSELETRIEIDFTKRQEELRQREQELLDLQKDISIKAKAIADREKLEQEKMAKRITDEKQRVADEANRILKAAQAVNAAEIAEMKKIDDFILTYVNNRGRQPLMEEIEEYFRATTPPMSESILVKYKSQHNINV